MLSGNDIAFILNLGFSSHFDFHSSITFQVQSYLVVCLMTDDRLVSKIVDITKLVAVALYKLIL